MCGYNQYFKLQSHNANYLRGWEGREIRQGLALGVAVGPSFFGFGVGPSFSWVEVGPLSGSGLLFGMGSALWVGVGPSFLGSGLPLRVGVGQGPETKEVGVGPFLLKGEDCLVPSLLLFL